MPRQPKFKTASELIQYYISLYYIMRERNPGIKHRTSDHIKKIDELEVKLNRDLERRYPYWDNEDNRRLFKIEIDFLTQVYTNIKKEKARKESVREFVSGGHRVH